MKVLCELNNLVLAQQRMVTIGFSHEVGHHTMRPSEGGWVAEIFPVGGCVPPFIVFHPLRYGSTQTYIHAMLMCRNAQLVEEKLSYVPVEDRSSCICCFLSSQPRALSEVPRSCRSSSCWELGVVGSGNSIAYASVSPTFLILCRYSQG